MDYELERLKREVELLKQKKEQKLNYSNSIKERNQLLAEIKDLDKMSKSPSALKSFGKSFGMGTKIVGKYLWKKAKLASRNIERSSPELVKISKQNYKSPYSDLGRMYLPAPIEEPIKLLKVKQPKLKKGKNKKFKQQKVFMRSGVQNPVSWELP